MKVKVTVSPKKNAINNIEQNIENVEREIKTVKLLRLAAYQVKAGEGMKVFRADTAQHMFGLPI